MVRGVLASVAGVLIVAAMLAGGMPAAAADLAPTVSQPRTLRPSHLVIGNYCGYGRRYGTLAAPAVDRVDLICKAHDACYMAGRDRCGCNADLLDALRRVLADPAVDRRVRHRARLVSVAIHAMNPYCHIFPHGLVNAARAHLLGPNRQ